MENKKENLFILNQNINKDTMICRYINFDVFLQLLYGKMYVPRRRNFLDVRESGRIPLKYRFAFGIIGGDYQGSQDIVKSKQQAIGNHVQILKQSSLLLTSCWALDNGENYLMWKSYTSQIGVCVKTTIGKLINHIDYEKDGFLPICSTMFYQDVYQQQELLEAVFSKDKFYISEDEVRIYFVPKGHLTDSEIRSFDNIKVEQLIYEMSKHEEEKTKNTGYRTFHFFDVDPHFINSIVLSPFIKSSTIDCFRDILMNKFCELFPNESFIKTSAIKEN